MPKLAKSEQARQSRPVAKDKKKRNNQISESKLVIHEDGDREEKRKKLVLFKTISGVGKGKDSLVKLPKKLRSVYSTRVTIKSNSLYKAVKIMSKRTKSFSAGTKKVDDHQRSSPEENVMQSLSAPGQLLRSQCNGNGTSVSSPFLKPSMRSLSTKKKEKKRMKSECCNPKSKPNTSLPDGLCPRISVEELAVRLNIGGGNSANAARKYWRKKRARAEDPDYAGLMLRSVVSFLRQ